MSKFSLAKGKFLKQDHKFTKKTTRAKKRARKRKLNRKNKKYQKLISPPHQQNSLFHLPGVMSGDCFWKNYSNVFHWQKNYQKYIQWNNFSPPTNVNQIDECPVPNVANNRLLEKRRPPSISDQEVPSEKVSEDEYILDEEFLKALEINWRFKEDMKKNKTESSTADASKLPGNCSERDNIEECLDPAEKSVDAKRAEEMCELYGDSAAKIMGMETALQLTFNRNCDVFKPSYWPNLPLTLKFS